MYTGESVTRATAVMDHAIPINKKDCGLHLFGNLVPCTRDANDRKHYRHYREFLMNSPERLERIEEWLRRTAYLKRAEAMKELVSLCSEKYAMIAGLCKDGREFAFRQFGTTVCQKETRRPLSSTESAVLPIELVSAPVQISKRNCSVESRRGSPLNIPMAIA